MNPYEHRRRLFALDEDEEFLRASFEDFFQKEVPLERVRAAEPLGFDAALWQSCIQTGLTSMAGPADAGGDDAGMVTMVLVAGELGRVLAPVPLIEHAVAIRALTAAGAESELVAAAIAGERILGFAPTPLLGRPLVSTAAIADDIVGFDGTRLVVVHADREHVPNRASLPAAWVDPSREQLTVLPGGDAATFERARREWAVLTAAALAGLTRAAIAIGAEFTKTRETMGVLIGALQGVAFPLVDAYSGMLAAQNLARRAAWFLDNDPATDQHLPATALVHAADAAVHGTSTAAHVQGGLGYTLEAGTTPYLLRAHGWALAGGDLVSWRRGIAHTVLEAHRAS